MRVSIRHDTVYRYSVPASYTIQVLRKTPRPDAHQRVLFWNLDAPGDLNRSTDAFGNITHTQTITRPHTQIRIAVEGAVETAPLTSGRLPDDTYPMSPLVHRVHTMLTQPDEAIVALAHQTLPKGLTNGVHALALTEAIRSRVKYEPGHTEVTSPAVQALELGRGVCQDHAHLFIACARVLGVPARYVSGYVTPTQPEESASYAWADVWLDNGWVSIDVSHGDYAGERHCRLAVGRDYDSAAPVRGVRTGGGFESMEVSVSVHSDSMPQQ